MGFFFKPGTFPILVSIPHNGSEIPTDLAARMTPDGRSSRDTDWFLDRLYDLPELADASLLVAQHSRYVIDLNRPRDNQSLYPGQTTTGLIPETCFDGAPIYAGALPDTAEVERRIAEVWMPYHEKIEQELQRLVDEHGVAVLVEAHSIASQVPRLFERTLPDFNLGTNRGTTCSPALQDAIVATLQGQTQYTHVANGRFLGGYITRCFGQPERSRHAVQIELSQATYMDEGSLSWDPDRAAQVQPVFQQIFSAIRQWVQ